MLKNNKNTIFAPSFSHTSIVGFCSYSYGEIAQMVRAQDS